MATAPLTEVRPTPRMSLRYWQWRNFADANPDFMAEIAALRASRSLALADLASAGRRAQRSMVRQLLHDRKFAVLGVYDGLRKMGRLRRATPETIRDRASRYDPFRPCHEIAVSRPVASPSGRRREVRSYGPLKRAHQSFVDQVIRALHPPRENQFLLRGGIPAALDAVEVAYRQRGMAYAVELDVSGFYGSVPFAVMARALRPLPDAVVRYVVFDEGTRTTGDRDHAIHGHAQACAPLDAPNGLPLGSASSPIAGEVLIGQLLADPRVADAAIITYADNLLVLGRSAQEATASADRLTAVAAEAAFGALRLREKGRGHLLRPGTAEGLSFASGVPFVGQMGTVDGDGTFSLEPAPERREAFMRVNSGIVPSRERIEREERRVFGYHRAYPRWQEREVREVEDRASLASAAYLAHPTSELLNEAARRIALAVLLNRGVRMVEEFIPEYESSFAGRRTAFERRSQTLRDAAERLLLYADAPGPEYDHAA